MFSTAFTCHDRTGPRGESLREFNRYLVPSLSTLALWTPEAVIGLQYAPLKKEAVVPAAMGVAPKGFAPNRTELMQASGVLTV